MTALALVPTTGPLPDVQLDEIDPGRWPAVLEMQRPDYAPWDTGLTPASRSEYIEALAALSGGTLQDDGSILASDWTFHLVAEGDDGPENTRCMWQSSDGGAYVLNLYDDERLASLSMIAPLDAAREISRRFAAALAQTSDTPWTVPPEFHALMISEAFSRTNSFPAYAEVDPWNATLSFIFGDGSDMPSSHVASVPYLLVRSDEPDSPDEHVVLLTGNVYMGGILGWERASLPVHKSWCASSRGDILQLAAEVNAVLANSRLPTIPESEAIRVADSAVQTLSINELNRFMINPQTAIANVFDGRFGWDEPISDTALLTVLDDLTTIRSCKDGVIQTATASYTLSPDQDDEGARQLVREGEDVVSLFLEDGAHLAADKDLLNFLAGLRDGAVNHIPPALIKQRRNLLQIIGHAVVELTLARHAETNSLWPISPTCSVRSNADGSIEIKLPDRGWPISGKIQTAQPIFTEDFRKGLIGPSFDLEGLWYENCSLLSAANLRKSAEQTLTRLGFADLSRIIRGIDSYHRLGQASLKDPAHE